MLAETIFGEAAAEDGKTVDSHEVVTAHDTFRLDATGLEDRSGTIPAIGLCKFVPGSVILVDQNVGMIRPVQLYQSLGAGGKVLTVKCSGGVVLIAER